MLSLRKETLAELTPGQMSVVVGATGACTQTLPEIAILRPDTGGTCFAVSCITNE